MASAIKSLFWGNIPRSPTQFLSSWIPEQRVPIAIQKELWHLPHISPSQLPLLQAIETNLATFVLQSHLICLIILRFLERNSTWKKKTTEITFLCLWLQSGQYPQSKIKSQYSVCEWCVVWHPVTKTSPTSQIWTNLYRSLDYETV